MYFNGHEIHTWQCDDGTWSWFVQGRGGERQMGCDYPSLESAEDGAKRWIADNCR